MRTAGGHRRFNPTALADWLATSPEPAMPRAERSTHVSPRPAAAEALMQRADRIAELAGEEYGTEPPRVTRERVLLLAHAMRTGRLADPLDRAEAFGRAHGAAGSSPDTALAASIGFERAVDDALADEPHSLSRADRDHVSATIRRITVRIADAWSAAAADDHANGRAAA